MVDQPRPVWLTPEEMEYPLGSVWAIVRNRWDAAPADATEAVERAILGTFPDLVGVRLSLGMDRSERAATACARAVLRALGSPADA